MLILPDEPTDEERLQELPEDYATPFRPPTDAVGEPTDDLERRQQAGQLSDTHPITDTNMQFEEAYDEGNAGAAEAQEPNAGNTVTGYDPAHDQRRSDSLSDSDLTAEYDGSEMDYAEFITAALEYSQGLGVDEAEDTLQMVTELIAVQMDSTEREAVASELPGRLRDLMLGSISSDSHSVDTTIEQIMATHNVAVPEARRRLQAVWMALKDGLSERCIDMIEARMSPQMRIVFEG
jgi:uncharacterized protein (DUF2267 family)